MNENKTVQEVLNALDEFLVYRTNGKLDELQRVRNRLRQERQKNAEQAERSAESATATAR